MDMDSNSIPFFIKNFKEHIRKKEKLYIKFQGLMKPTHSFTLIKIAGLVAPGTQKRIQWYALPPVWHGISMPKRLVILYVLLLILEENIAILERTVGDFSVTRFILV